MKYLLLCRYVASCGAIWNSFISMLNKHMDSEKEKDAAGAAIGTGASKRG